MGKCKGLSFFGSIRSVLGGGERGGMRNLGCSVLGYGGGTREGWV